MHTLLHNHSKYTLQYSLFVCLFVRNVSVLIVGININCLMTLKKKYTDFYSSLQRVQKYEVKIDNISHLLFFKTVRRFPFPLNTKL